MLEPLGLDMLSQWHWHDWLVRALHLQATEKQVTRLQLKLQRQQRAIEEVEALKVCLT